MAKDNSTQSIGKTMSIMAWVCIMGILTLLFSDILSRQKNPNRSPKTTREQGINEVKLVRNKYHHYVVTGKINDQTVTFMVDTGATTVAIPVTVAKRLGLQPGLVGYAQTANGTVETRETRLDSLQIGTIKLYDIRANITYGMQGNEILLGMSALKHVEFIHRNGELTLRQY